MSNVSFLGSLEEWHDCDSFGIAIRRITTTSCTIVGIPPAAQDIPALLSVYLPTLEEGSLALGARPEESARSSVEFGTARGLASSVGCCTISFGSPLLQRTPSSRNARKTSFQGRVFYLELCHSRHPLHNRQTLSWIFSDPFSCVVRRHKRLPKDCHVVARSIFVRSRMVRTRARPIVLPKTNMLLSLLNSKSKRE